MSRLSHTFGDEWRSSLTAPFAGVSMAGVLAWMSSVPWAIIVPMLGAAVTTIGGALIGMRTQARLSQIKIEMAELELLAMRKKIEGTPAIDLHPEEIGREARELLHETAAKSG
jgi:hypothetical protein